MTARYDLGYEIYGDTIIFTDTGFDLYVSLTYSANGLEVATDLLDYNAYLVNLRSFEIDGYTFGGWYYDKEFTKPALSTDKLTSNITIYAKLTEIENPSFWQKVGNALTSSVAIIIYCALAALLVFGGIGYAVRKKK